jgi:hypothetical protein
VSFVLEVACSGDSGEYDFAALEGWRMGRGEEMSFEVYVRTRSAVVTLVREVSFRTAHVVARHHADTRGQDVFIRNRLTKAVETVGPSRC